jgi:uncharacterized protein YodC (DUF2158 family)
MTLQLAQRRHGRKRIEAPKAQGLTSVVRDHVREDNPRRQWKTRQAQAQWKRKSRSSSPKGQEFRLNAGGPIMAVKGYAEDDFFSDGPGVVCQWFSGRKLESGNFAPETLILVKDDAEEERPS